MALAGPAAFAQDAVSAQSARQGMIFAYRWCGTCHMDSTHRAPPFEEIAQTRAVSADYLRAYLTNPPHGMVRFDVSEAELMDLQNYFTSLRK